MNSADLKALRARLNLTQAQMAERLGISLALYSLYERDRQTISKPVAKLAAMLG